MSEQDFLRLFAEAVGASEGAKRLDTPLNSLDRWDSAACHSTTLLDGLAGVAVSPEAFLGACVPRDIMSMATPKN